jgi:hypothetical protein
MKYQIATLKQITKGDNTEVVVILQKDSTTVLSLTDALVDSQEHWSGDQVYFYKKHGQRHIINRSCQVLLTARFRRNLNGLMKKLANPGNPLNRVLVRHKEHAFWLIPYEQHLRHRWFQNLSSDREFEDEAKP